MRFPQFPFKTQTILRHNCDSAFHLVVLITENETHLIHRKLQE